MRPGAERLAQLMAMLTNPCDWAVMPDELSRRPMSKKHLHPGAVLWPPNVAAYAHSYRSLVACLASSAAVWFVPCEAPPAAILVSTSRSRISAASCHGFSTVKRLHSRAFGSIYVGC